MTENHLLFRWPRLLRRKPKARATSLQRPSPIHSLLLQQKQPSPQDAWVSLFNGNDLTGWTVDGGDSTAWRVAAGELIAVDRSGKEQEWLLTEATYSNFQLKFEYQLSAGANTGVGIRSTPGLKKHLEIQIIDDTHPQYGKILPNKRTGSLWNLASTSRPAPSPPSSSWNKMDVTLRDKALQVVVNGEEVLNVNLSMYANRSDQFPALSASAGARALQNLAGTVRFHNIQIKRLEPVSEPASLDFAPARVFQ